MLVDDERFQEWLQCNEDDRHFYMSETCLIKDTETNKSIFSLKTSWIKVKPSIINTNIKLPTSSIRGENVFDFNSDHLIALPTFEIEKLLECDTIHIYLAGTGSSPTNHHTANWWLYNSCHNNIPAISLSYQWGNYSDIEKNEYCNSSLSGDYNSQQILDSYHKCIVFGGSNDMISVAENSCIISRIEDLFNYLRINGPYQAYWNKFYKNYGELDYSKIIISGHSQGSGHACYLAKHKLFKRCILISGPQELLPNDDNEDINSNISWLDGKYATKDIYSFMHKKEEYTADLIVNNWKRINELSHNNEIQIKEYIYNFDDNINIKKRTFYTSLMYNDRNSNNILESHRPYHNSTVGDLYTPRDINNIPIYFNSIWKQLISFES